MSRNNQGFTLLELLLVIVIMGVLATLMIGNFLTSIKKGRDSKRKQDIQAVQKALELYYADNQSYPQSPSGGVAFPVSGYPDLCHPTGGCNTATYMKNLPSDPSSGYNFFYVSDTKSYQIYSCLENDQDVGPGVKQAGYTSTDCNCANSSTGDLCKFGVSSSNTTP